GAREHALLAKLSASPKIEQLYAIPGNPGIARIAHCVDIAVTDIEAIVDFAKQQQIELVVVGPEQPLVMGLADALSTAGINVFGPTKDCAQLEGSKKYAKDFMMKYHIPTAAYQCFTSSSAAKHYLEQLADGPVVIKASGLAAGKGVMIAEHKNEARAIIDLMLTDNAFGDSGKEIVIEEFLQGEEVSILTFVDGKTLIPML